jgi:hypothetical protein
VWLIEAHLPAEAFLHVGFTLQPVALILELEKVFS